MNANIPYTILLQIIKMFLMICVGIILYKKKIITTSVITGLSNILLYIATPCIIVNSFLQEYSPEKVPNLIFVFFMSIIIHILCIFLSKIVYPKGDPIDQWGLIFSNSGFIGIPLVQGVFGDEAVFYLAPFIGIFYVFVWTYGIWIMCHDKRQISIKKLLLNPSIIALVFGILTFFFQINIPSPIHGSISSFAGLNTPLAMIVLGGHLAKGGILEILKNRKAYKVSFFRLFLAPLITAAILSLFPSRWDEVKNVLLIAESAPIGALSPVFAQKYEEDSTYAAQTVCLSTLLCIITIPIIMTIAEAIK